MKIKIILPKIIFIIVTFLIIYSFLNILLVKKELYFVDSARYAEVARSVVETGEFVSKFTFPSSFIPIEGGWETNLPPMQIVVLSAFFVILGVSDVAVVYASSVFFIGTILLTFLLAKQLYGDKVGIFSALFCAFTPQLINYARDGGAELLFIFQLILISYLIVLQKKWSLILGGIIAGLSLFTKLQSFLFLPIFVIWVIFLYKMKDKIFLFLGGLLFTVLIHKLGILLNHYYIDIPIYLSLQQSSLYPSDDIVRSGSTKQIGLESLLQNVKVFLSKIFYNLYNFYKSVLTFTNILPLWTSPLLVVSFILSNINFFRKEDRHKRIFRLIVLGMVLGSFLLAAATSPHIRYAHLTIPFIIILTTDFLITVFSKLGFSKLQINLIMVVILTLFMMIPFLGNTILDARFNAQAFNLDKPYAQKYIGQKVGELTKKDDVVVTNLDTWGSWYGNRKTILITLDLKTLEQLDKKTKIDAIFLTDYQRYNEDHPLSEEWGMLFDLETGNFIANNFKLEKIATISAAEVYERKDYTYKLWVRN